MMIIDQMNQMKWKQRSAENV